jgi:hypothetical protein
MIEVGQVKGTKSFGDVMTKHLRPDVVASCLTMLGLMDMVEASFGETVAHHTPKAKSWKQPKMLSAIYTLGLRVTQVRVVEDGDPEKWPESEFDFRGWLMFRMVLLSALGFGSW